MTQAEQQEAAIFKFDFSSQNPIAKKFLNLIESPLEKVLAINKINSIYADNTGQDSLSPHLTFPDQVLKFLNITYQIPNNELERIPKTGPVIVIANHPFGMIEGIILAAFMNTVRSDLKIMANYLLGRIRELKDIFIMTDPFGRADSPQKNFKAVKEAISCLKNNGMLVIFPAGEVSHLNLNRRQVTDPAWTETVPRLVKMTGAPVLPIFFEGKNSALFQMLGLVHPKLRTMMLPRQLLNKMNKTITIRIGNVISYQKLKNFSSTQDMLQFLRFRTYMLQNSKQKVRRQKFIKKLFRQKPVQSILEFEPLITTCKTQEIIQEIERIPGLQLLVESGEFQVFAAKAEQIPEILYELGRLREITFREVGEGTGKAIDLDVFDNYYYHLFIWDKKAQQIVGAYRMGPSDEILARGGKEGFYTSSLFKYKTKFLEGINPGLELGRSFIRPEYQKVYSSLLLLWKGIGQFIVKNPKYKILFGPVSISNDYHPVSQQLMIKFLKLNNFHDKMAKLVKPKTPPKSKKIKGWQKKDGFIINDLDDISDLVADFEIDNKGIPILLKQYIKLGGKILAFNIDPDFNDVLDGLIMVDLTETSPKMLERYLGKAGTSEFLTYHQSKSVEVAS